MALKRRVERTIDFAERAAADALQVFERSPAVQRIGRWAMGGQSRFEFGVVQRHTTTPIIARTESAANARGMFFDPETATSLIRKGRFEDDIVWRRGLTRSVEGMQAGWLSSSRPERTRTRRSRLHARARGGAPGWWSRD